jgi:hypothetical protein
MPLMNPGTQSSNDWLARDFHEQAISFPFDDVDAHFSLPIALALWFADYDNVLTVHDCRGISKGDIKLIIEKTGGENTVNIFGRHCDLQCLVFLTLALSFVEIWTIT